MSQELTKKDKKKSMYLYILYILCNNNEPFLDLWHTRKSGSYTTTSNDQLCGWTEKKIQSPSQSQTCIKKRWWPLFGGVLPVWSITSEEYAQQADEVQWRLQCLQSALVNRKGTILPQDNAWLHVTQTTLQKVNDLGYQGLPHPLYSPDLLPTDYHFFWHLNNFLQGKCCTTSRRQKMLSKSLTNPEAWIFIIQE